ncbi:hypothetical protein I6I92_10725 [Peptoniphilus asaccharolyticus]|nr:hypothetical protein [Peptoniphilus asaccharolyticus]MBL7576263.1 hypothetical protein [Peptoniphilus asaccharolyticus]
MFLELKERLQYNRRVYRSIRAEICDMYLIVLGMNLNQLHRKLIKTKT